MMPTRRITPRPPARARRSARGPRLDAASSRRRLFDAATREFARHGFSGASVDRIAAAARLNKAMIYYHFASKAGLYQEILRDMFAAVAARVRPLAGSPEDPAEQIRLFVGAIAEEAEARPHFPPIWFREIADGGVHLDHHTLGAVQDVVATLSGIVEAGVRSGDFQPINPILVHAGIVAPLLLFFASEPLRQRMERMGVRGAARFDRGQVVAHIQIATIDLLRRGAAAGAAPERAGRRKGRSR